MMSMEDERLSPPIGRISLVLNCSRLPRTGTLKKYPDTYAKVTTVPSHYAASGEATKDQGSTETIMKNSNPRWTKVFLFDYEFGSQLTIRVDVLSGGADDSASQKSLGAAFFELGSVLGSKNKTKVKRLPMGGCIFAHVDQCSGSTPQRVIFQLSASHLKCKQKLLSRSEPSTFFEVSRQTKMSQGNKWVAIYRSQPVLESLRPCWDKADIDLETFCNGDVDRPIQVAVYIHKKKGNHPLIGSFETTTAMLLNKAKQRSKFVLQDPRAREMFGTIEVKECTLTSDASVGVNHISFERGDAVNNLSQSHESAGEGIGNPSSNPSSPESISERQSISSASVALDSLPCSSARLNSLFADYISSGLDIDLCIAIDFTSSNGDPRVPGTLHYRTESSLNDYEETIASVGRAVAKHSRQSEFPVWGFGAKFGGQTRHLFQCGAQAAARGVDGVLDAYQSVFDADLTMSGPTVLLSVIKAAAHRAQGYGAPLRYGILLVLTDGIVSDSDATKRLMHSVSVLPLTVVMVGIGDADFAVMDEMVRYSNATSRPNAAFAALRRHQHDPAELATEVLRDVPDHIVGYFRGRGIEPTATATATATATTSLRGAAREDALVESLGSGLSLGPG